MTALTSSSYSRTDCKRTPLMNPRACRLRGRRHLASLAAHRLPFLRGCRLDMWAALRSRAAFAAAHLAPSPPVASSAAAPRIFSFSGLTQFTRNMANKGYVTMKRRFKGLYGGKHIKFGNTISFSHRKCAHLPKLGLVEFTRLVQSCTALSQLTSVRSLVLNWCVRTGRAAHGSQTSRTRNSSRTCCSASSPSA